MKKLLCVFAVLSINNAYPMFKGFFGSNAQPSAVSLAHPNPSVSTEQQSNRELSVVQPGALQAVQPAAAPIPPAAPTARLEQDDTAKTVIHVNIQPNMNVHNINNQNAQANAQSSSIALQETHQTTFTILKNSIFEHKERGVEQLYALKEWIKSHKIKIILASCGTSYALLALYLVHAHYRMQDQILWSRWRYEESFEQLMSIPQKQLAHDLVFAIQRKYTTSAQFSDFIRPLVQFMRDIEQEKKMLKHYIEITKWIGTFRLQRIFPFNDTKIELAKNLLQRILFFEHVFLSWAAEFKIRQNDSAIG